MRNIFIAVFLSFSLTAMTQEVTLEELANAITTASLGTNDKMEANYFLLKARNAYYTKRYDDAKSLVKKSVKRSPYSHVALELAGDIEFALGNEPKALGYYNRAIAVGLENPELFFKVGQMNYELENYEDAIDNYSRAILLDEKNARAFIGRANSKFMLELYNPAIEDYKSAISMNPNLALAYQGMGHAYTMVGNYVQALKELNRAIELNPNDAISYYYRGITYQKSYNRKKSCDDFQVAAGMGHDAAKKALKDCDI